MENDKEPSAKALYGRHAALNTGVLLHDIRHLFSHPIADKIAPKGGSHHALSSVALSLPDIAMAAYSGAVPPQLTHTKDELSGLHAGSAKQWFLNGLNPEKHPVNMDDVRSNKAMKVAFYDELAKLGAISDEHAQRALNRLDALEHNKPNVSELGRAVGMGAVAGPAIRMVGNAVGGRPLMDFGQAAGSSPLRGLLGTVASGALTAGALPVLRHHLDHRAAKSTLSDYLAERMKEDAGPINQSAGGVPGMTGTLPLGEQKLGFEVSQYSGPLSEGRFPMVSGMPPFKRPPLNVSPLEKKAGGATTPAGILASSRATGLPKITAPGGSIAAIAKPKGFGTPEAGAISPNSLL